MNRKEIKAKAKAQLGGRIFANNWMLALLVCLIFSAVSYLPNVIPGLGQIGMIILLGPMTYGLAELFLEQARDGIAMEVKGIFSGFQKDFAQNFLIMLMSGIFAFLWGLLFVIPGIVKTYAYSMAYYIKVDHPDYDWRQCINESKRITKGHKGELFVLDLSFIGWLIVGALCFGVGLLWVTPYMNAAKAQFYNELVKKEAPAVETAAE